MQYIVAIAPRTSGKEWRDYAAFTFLADAEAYADLVLKSWPGIAVRITDGERNVLFEGEKVRA